MAGTASAYQRPGATRHNVGTADRVVSALLGAWMLTGRRKRRRGIGKVFAVVGGALLLQRAASGHSMVYEQLGVSSAALDEGAGINIEQDVTINRPLHEVYEFMRDLTNLPIVFTHLARVQVGPGGISHWTLNAGPRGREIKWDVQVLNDVPNDYISWTSTPESALQQSGSVHFTSVRSGATQVHVKLRYRPPGGAWGFGLAKMLNDITARQVGEDLGRLKQLLETKHGISPLASDEESPSVAEPGPNQPELFESNRAGKATVVPSVGTAVESRTGAVEPMRPLNEPEPVVVRGWELEPEASPEIAGAPVPRVELERVMASLEGADAARPVEPVDEDFRGGRER